MLDNFLQTSVFDYLRCCTNSIRYISGASKYEKVDIRNIYEKNNFFFKQKSKQSSKSTNSKYRRDVYIDSFVLTWRSISSFNCFVSIFSCFDDCYWFCKHVCDNWYSKNFFSNNKKFFLKPLQRNKFVKEILRDFYFLQKFNLIKRVKPNT